jgi:hypothetical protein
MIANLETYTQNFYIEFVRAVDEEIINCKRRIDILNTVLQDKTVFV